MSHEGFVERPTCTPSRAPSGEQVGAVVGLEGGAGVGATDCDMGGAGFDGIGPGRLHVRDAALGATLRALWMAWTLPG